MSTNKPEGAVDYVARAAELGELLRRDDAEAEKLGQLTPAVAAALRDSGIMRMLQPTRFGGAESSAADFVRAVITLGSHSPAAGWVTGVVGVHAHELAIGSMRMQEEIWGEDNDTWVASPYAPRGVARPVEGGYLFNGRWEFSSGTDHCQWVMIGGRVQAEGSEPNTGEVRHFVLPRSDYEIVADSWDVVGLRGTGSRDLAVRDAFVPEHRTIKVDEASWMKGLAENGVVAPVYSIPRSVMFGTAISAGSIATAQAVLNEFMSFSLERSKTFNYYTNAAAAPDTHTLRLLGAAAADIESSIAGFIAGVERADEIAREQGTIGLDDRIVLRRDRIRHVRRAIDAADLIYTNAGGTALRMNHPLQRRWRDMRAALNHRSNASADGFYTEWAMNALGMQLPASATTF